ncbi:MAG: enoyl-CoA hydratase/isomerase family protein [Candidatus Sericytochromatia bacterium]
MTEPTRIEITPGPITTLTLHCERGLNLLQTGTIADLQQALQELQRQKDLRVLILSGGLGKSFCAGADIGELLSLDNIPYYVEQGQQLMESLFHFPVPVIAAINGYALGAGFSLALACELRVISEQARIGQLAVRNGLTPPFGNIQHLLQAIGPVKTKELLYTGRVFSASEAEAAGLINRVVPHAELLNAAQQLAEEICVAPGHAISWVKRIVNRTIEEGHAVGYLTQEEALIQCLGDERTRSILGRFLKQ